MTGDGNGAGDRGPMVDSPVPDLRRRLTEALGRHVSGNELQADLLVELLEKLEELQRSER